MSDKLKENFSQLEKQIEALLLVSPSPISITQLSNVLNEKSKDIEEAINSIKDYYLESRGIRIEENKGRFQITSAPEYSKIIENYLGQEESTTLSQAALEALSIVAYRQPITRPEVDEIRGVNSDGVMRNLLNKGLIQEIGRNEGAGRPILYGVTNDFLQYFGLASLKELPQFEVTPVISDGNSKILKD
jgi:segregation and condensation protein B